MKLAIIGAGWAGLAAAMEAVRAGHRVEVFEMSGTPGGRGRSLGEHEGLQLDCGQHILIGAYTETLRLMRSVGVEPSSVLTRRPLSLIRPDGQGLRLPSGPPVLAFLRGLYAQTDWSGAEKWSLLRALLRWRLQGFRCADQLSVADLCADLPVRIIDELIEPLCVAALNTPMHCASARVFLRVLRDGLFEGPGGSDLMIPRVPLQALWPEPTERWLRMNGAQLHLRHRVESLVRVTGASGSASESTGAGAGADMGWAVDGQAFDGVILACSATEAARLAKPHSAPWAEAARALEFEPIVTCYVRSEGTRLAAPMLALPQRRGDERGHDRGHQRGHQNEPLPAPAQFVFDLGQLGHPGAPLIAFVASAAGRWLDQGLTTLEAAILEQAANTPGLVWAQAPQVVRSVAERRATFLCKAGMRRPAQRIADHLVAAADYVEGPYPSTLEGAMRSGVAAAQHFRCA